MKNFLRNTLLTALGMALWPSGAGAALAVVNTINQGDLLLGIQASGGQGVNDNLFINLGSAIMLRDNPSPGVVGNIADVLDDYFQTSVPGDWYNRTDLYFGVFGNLNNNKVSGSTAGAPANGDAPTTVYVSRGTTTAGASVPWSGFGQSILAEACTKHKGQITMVRARTPLAGVTESVAYLNKAANIVEWNNGWTIYNDFPSAFQGTAYGGIFSGGIQGRFGQGRRRRWSTCNGFSRPRERVPTSRPSALLPTAISASTGPVARPPT